MNSNHIIITMLIFVACFTCNPQAESVAVNVKMPLGNFVALTNGAVTTNTIGTIKQNISNQTYIMPIEWMQLFYNGTLLANETQALSSLPRQNPPNLFVFELKPNYAQQITLTAQLPKSKLTIPTTLGVTIGTLRQLIANQSKEIPINNMAIVVAGLTVTNDNAKLGDEATRYLQSWDKVITVGTK